MTKTLRTYRLRSESKSRDFGRRAPQGRPRVETEGQCIERRFRHFIEGLDDFPTGNAFSQETLEALQECAEDSRAALTS